MSHSDWVVTETIKPKTIEIKKQCPIENKMDDRLPTLLPPSGAPTFLTPSAPSSSRQQYQQFLDVEEFQQLSKIANSQQQTSKYAQLLAVIEEMGEFLFLFFGCHGNWIINLLPWKLINKSPWKLIPRPRRPPHLRRFQVEPGTFKALNCSREDFGSRVPHGN